MDLRKLKTLIDLVSDSNISELEITEADGKVRIVKADPNSHSQQVHHAPAQLAPAIAAPPLTGAESAVAEEAVQSGHIVKSPMVGTYYGAASPGAKPFLEIGSVVKEGQPACIIEAMKIMNEIECDKSGTITQVLCENGQAVEFGQPLFIVE
jgi:acetyl-CoA carboxylase biotin carboxyl carrier protein